MEKTKPINFNTKESTESKKEITEIKYQGEPTDGEMVFTVYYTDANSMPNNRYFFYYPTNPGREIEFTDGTEFYGNLKQRIQYELHKYLQLKKVS